MASIEALLKLLQGDERVGWLDAGQCGPQLAANRQAIGHLHRKGRRQFEHLQI